MTHAPTFLEIQVRELRIPFKVAFRHASASRSETSSLWATARTARGLGFGESCPRPYVTGETVAHALEFCERQAAAVTASVTDITTLRDWTTAHQAEIDANPAAWCALELAVLDALARDQHVTVEALLGLPLLPGTFRYSAVIGDGPIAAFTAMADRYRAFGFTDLKLKLSGDVDRDRAKAAALRGWPALKARADANNLWTDAATAIAFMHALEAPLWALEEPIAANRYDELLAVAEALDCRIILDESLMRVEQLRALPPPASRWIVNIRVSKMGGLIRSLDVVREARRCGHGVIVGAQVGETSLLTRAALPVAAAAGPALLAQEGAFGTELLAADVTENPLMFGRAGVLDLSGSPVLASPGFGLDIDPARIPQ